MGVARRQGCQSEGAVAEYVGAYAAGADHDERAALRVVYGPDDELGAAADHRLYQHRAAAEADEFCHGHP